MARHDHHNSGKSIVGTNDDEAFQAWRDGQSAGGDVEVQRVQPGRINAQGLIRRFGGREREGGTGDQQQQVFFHGRPRV